MKFILRQKIVISIVTLAMFIELLDSSALNTSLPQIANYFSVKTCDVGLAVTVYLFALGVFIPLSGFLAEKFGERNVIVFSFVLFMLGSIGCGLSATITQLICFRLIQGIGGSFMFPVGRLILAKEFGKDLIRAMSLVTAISLTGPIIGPILGGYLTTFFGWQWIFFLNVPFLLMGIFLANKYLSNEEVSSGKKFDLLGFLILFTGFGLVIFSANPTIENHSLAYRVFYIASGLIAVILYIPYAKKTSDALIDLKIFENKIFRCLSMGSFILRFTTAILMFIIPILFFEKYKFSPFYIGIMMLPFIVGTWIIKPFLVLITKKDSNKSLLVVNSLFLACAQFCFIAFIDGMNLGAFIFYAVIVGILNSVQVALMNTFMFLSLPNKDKAQGNAAYLALSQLGGCIGVTFSTLILIAFSPSSINLFPYYLLTCIISIVTLSLVFFIKPVVLKNLTIQAPA